MPELPRQSSDVDRPVIGYCAKCGEARTENYTCRSGGHTVPWTPPRRDGGGEAQHG